MYEKKSKSSQPALIWDENHSVNAYFWLIYLIGQIKIQNIVPFEHNVGTL